MIVASKKERASYYLFLIPAFVIFGVFIFWPTVQSFYLSLCKYSLSSIKSAEYIGLKNFTQLFKNKVFWQAMKNTAIYTVFTVPFLMAAGLFLAMLIAMIVSGAIGSYAASMLLAKSLRVFRGSWKGLAVTALCAAVICGVMKFDVFGIETWIPEAEEVVSVTMNVSGEIELAGYDTLFVCD